MADSRAYAATMLIKSLQRTILLAAEKHAYFHGCSGACKVFVKTWENLPTEPRRVNGEWESVYRRKRLKSEYKHHSPLFSASNKIWLIVPTRLSTFQGLLTQEHVQHSGASAQSASVFILDALKLKLHQ